MRKIEQQMNAAISNSQNWQSGNTAVVSDSDGVSRVYLHGNKIAEIGDDYVQIFDGGYQSKTTKSRLNAILSEHGIKGEGVFQRDWKWYVHKFIGQTSITGPVYNEYDFEDGFMFA
jgi:hypothetical protein